MNTSNAKQAAENLLTDYAEVLNTGNYLSIPSFYTYDGLFMPDGCQSIKADNITKSGERFLKKHSFHISFDIQNISEDKEFVFIQANATTKIKADMETEAIHLTSRDFFVLIREDTVWKIYRYIFNQDHQ